MAVFEGKIDGFEASMGKMSQLIGEHKAELAEAGVAIAAFGTAAVAALTEAAEHAAKFETQIYDLNQRLGLTTETLSGLKLAAEASGSTIDAVSMGMRKLATDAEGAANGLKAQSDLFDRLGVSATNTDGSLKDLGSLFPEVATALSQVTNSTELAADATALFGRGGLALLPVLKQGAAGIKEWSDKANELGVSVSSAQAAAGKAFELAQHDFEQSINGIVLSIGNALLPALTDLANKMADVIAPIHTWIEANPGWVQAIAEVSLGLIGAGGLLVGIAAVSAAIPLLTAGFGALTAGLGAVVAVLPEIGIAIAAIVAAWALWDIAKWIVDAGDLSSKIDNIWQAVKNLSSQLADLASEVADQAVRSLGSAFDNLKTAVQPATSAIGEFFAIWAKTQLNNVADGVNGIATGLQLLNNDLGAADKQLQQFQTDQISNIQAQQQWGAQLENNAHAHDGLKTAIQAVADTMAKADPISKKLQASIDSMVQSVEGETVKDRALEPAIQQLLKDKVSESAIYDTLGPQIEKYVEKLKDEDATLPHLVQKLYDANQQRQIDLTLRIAQSSAYATMNTARDTETQQLITNTQHTMLYDDAITELGTDVHAAFIEAGIARDQQAALDQVMKQSLQTMDLMGKSVGRLGNTFYDTHEQFAAFKQILGAPAPDVFVGSIDTSIKVLGKNASETLRQATKDVETSAGHVFDDMLIKGKGVFSSLADALKGGALSIGRSIFSDVVGYLGGPIKKAFDDFFTGLLESSGLKGFLTGLGNKLGGLLGGILGGGGGGGLAITGIDIGASIGGAGAGAAAGGAAAGGGGLMATAGAFMTNPITLGIGAAILGGVGLYEAFKSNTHLKANDFVKQYQNPFGANLEEIVNQFNAARASGSLTVSDANKTLDSVKTLIGGFEQNISDWRAKGGEYAIVANQAQATMDADFGTNFSAILDSMQTNIDQRQGIIDDPVVDATNANTDATKNLTDAFTAYDPSACTCDAIGNTIDTITKTITPQATLGPTFGTNPTAGISTANYNTAVSAMMGGGTPNNYGNANTTVASVNAAAATHNGTAITTPTGTIYLNAQQLSDLANSGGSYTLSSGYKSLISNAVSGMDLGTSVLYSPGSVAAMTDAERHAAGIPGYASGGPTRRGLSMLHDDEYVVPKNGALVKGGGGGRPVNVYIYANDAKSFRDSMSTWLPVIVDAVHENPQGEGDRLRQVLSGTGA